MIGPGPAEEGVPEGPRAASGKLLEEWVTARAMGDAAFDRARHRIQRESRLSTGYLGIGAVVIGAAVVVRGLIGFGWAAPISPWGWMSAAGWAMLLITFSIVVSIASGGRGVLPVSAFRAALAAGATAMALDVLAVLAAEGTGPRYPTVEIGVGATILACVSFRPIRELIRGLVGLAVTATIGLVAVTLVVPGQLDVGVSNVLLTITPAAAVLALVSVFDRHVREQFDRIVAESTIGAAGHAPGILAVSSLTKLDERAEHLLDEIGRPRSDDAMRRQLLQPEWARAAAELGEQLRAALVADAEMTWLQLAVSDSVQLSPIVTIRDPDGRAAALEPRRRSALLSVVWLLAARTGVARNTIDLAFEATPARGTEHRDGLGALEITLAGARLRSVDGSLWPLLDRLGPRSVDTRANRIRVTLGAVGRADSDVRETSGGVVSTTRTRERR